MAFNCFSATVVDDIFLEQVNAFEYVECNVCYMTNNNVMKKLYKFNHMCGTSRRTLNLTMKESHLTLNNGPPHISLWLWDLDFYEVPGQSYLSWRNEIFLARGRVTLQDHKRNVDVRQELDI